MKLDEKIEFLTSKGFTEIRKSTYCREYPNYGLGGKVKINVSKFHFNPVIEDPTGDMKSRVYLRNWRYLTEWVNEIESYTSNPGILCTYHDLDDSGSMEIKNIYSYTELRKLTLIGVPYFISKNQDIITHTKDLSKVVVLTQSGEVKSISDPTLEYLIKTYGPLSKSLFNT